MKEKNVKVFKLADISCKYITAIDGDLISNKKLSGHIASVDPLVSGTDSPGEIFWVHSDPDLFKDQIDEYTKKGFSSAFIRIFEYLHSKGIEFVRFDSDGEEADGFPEFDW